MSEKYVYHDIVAKLNRANKHINDLDACWIHARETNQSEVVSECDPQSGDVSYYIAKLTPIPSDIPLILGDALQNLRSVLDHLVYALVVKNGGVPTTRTAFPIMDTPERYKKESPALMNGVHHLAAHRIDGFYPYKGGHEYLWMLHRLNNIDKHRLLLTVCMVPTGKTLSPIDKEFLRSAFRHQHPESPDPTWLDAAVFAFGPSEDGLPRILDEGYKLLTVPAAQAHSTIHFSADIAFNEPGIVEGRTVFWILKTIQSEVRIIVDSLAMYL